MQLRPPFRMPSCTNQLESAHEYMNRGTPRRNMFYSSIKSVIEEIINHNHNFEKNFKQSYSRHKRKIKRLVKSITENVKQSMIKYYETSFIIFAIMKSSRPGCSKKHWNNTPFMFCTGNQIKTINPAEHARNCKCRLDPNIIPKLVHPDSVIRPLPTLLPGFNQKSLDSPRSGPPPIIWMNSSSSGNSAVFPENMVLQVPQPAPAAGKDQGDKMLQPASAAYHDNEDAILLKFYLNLYRYQGSKILLKKLEFLPKKTGKNSLFSRKKSGKVD